MKAVACILVPPESPYLRMDLPAYGTYAEALLGFLSGSGPFERILLLELEHEAAESGRSLSKAVIGVHGEIARICRIKGRMWTDIVDCVAEELPQEKGELWWFWADNPFLSSHISKEVLDLMRRYKADFAFADGYPKGIAPELFSLARIPSLRQLARLQPLEADRRGIFELIQKDINAFHIETRISEYDHRLRRLELHSETRRSHLMVRRLAEHLYRAEQAETWSDEDFERCFDENIYPQRTIPAEIRLQLSGVQVDSCIYNPYQALNRNAPGAEPFMSFEHVQSLLEKLGEFIPEATFSLMPFGEPGLHPEIGEILAFLERETPYEVFVETSGLGWKSEVLKAFLDSGPRKTRFIVGLDTNDPQRFKELGKTGLEEVKATIALLMEAIPEKVYVQTVRMSGGEEDLLEFYRSWEKLGANIIIQKYDSYAGLLPDRKVVDLQPVKRFPCWHLKRQMSILLDGTVVRCKEDVLSQYPLGNIFRDPVEGIWDALEPLYDRHRGGEYPDSCGNCDEYYTFSF